MIPTRVVSSHPALRWEDAMVSGNGSTGIMVMGRPLDELVVINHEKLWVVKAKSEPKTPDLKEAWAHARSIAFEGQYKDAIQHANEKTRAGRAPIMAAELNPNAHRIAYDHIHPGLHFHIDTESRGQINDYRRETVLGTGEVIVEWRDASGSWSRRTFVSRTDDAIVMEYSPPAGELMQCRMRLTEAPGKQPNEMGAVTISHADNEMYFHAAYELTMGKPEAEGYHVLARVVRTGGSAYAIEDERTDMRQAERVLVIMRLQYLDRANAADKDALRKSLAELPADYDELLARHAPAHSEMMDRVTLDLGTPEEGVSCSEDLLADVAANGPSPEFLEMLHAVGRYAMVTGGTGDLPVALSGIWGNTWVPAWDGRYTFDANINLAITSASQGNLPELMDAFCSYIDGSMEDWQYNAGQVLGCRGPLADLCQGWRHGKAVMLYPWVSGAGWLASYVYDHYVFTNDRDFLRDRALPLLKEIGLFYEDFLAGTETPDGKVRFYPSLSPENMPIIDNQVQSSGVVPNATCDIAICREALTNLIAACKELDVEHDGVARWEALLAKLPEYIVNDDGALAEWSYPGLRDRYNHRHSSHLYPLYPAFECSPERAPEMFEAARKAVDKRLEAGLGNKSAHGILHILFVAARLKDAELAWQMLDDFARLRFINSSMISCHNPGLMIFNLDSTFSMPGVITELLLYSEPGIIELLPALPEDRFVSGTIRGLRARGDITVEMFHWNMRTRRLLLQLRSGCEQSVVVNRRAGMRGASAAEGSEGDVAISRVDTGWQLDLPADRSVRILCSI